MHKNMIGTKNLFFEAILIVIGAFVCCVLCQTEVVHGFGGIVTGGGTESGGTGNQNGKDMYYCNYAAPSDLGGDACPHWRLNSAAEFKSIFDNNNVLPSSNAYSDASVCFNDPVGVMWVGKNLPNHGLVLHNIINDPNGAYRLKIVEPNMPPIPGDIIDINNNGTTEEFEKYLAYPIPTAVSYPFAVGSSQSDGFHGNPNDWLTTFKYHGKDVNWAWLINVNFGEGFLGKSFREGQINVAAFCPSMLGTEEEPTVTPESYIAKGPQATNLTQGSIQIKPGETVTFKHVWRSDKNLKDQVTKECRIWLSTDATPNTIPNNLPSSNNSSSSSCTGKDLKPTDSGGFLITSPPTTDNAGMTIFDVKIDKPGKYCQSAYYKGTASPSQIKGNQVCVTVTEKIEECLPGIPKGDPRCSEIPGLGGPETCPIPGYSGTVSSGKVSISTHAQNLTTARDSWKEKVFAKPGDEIQFRHYVCAGANAVKSSWSDGGDHGSHTSLDGESTGRNAFFNHGGGSYTISASSPSSKYIFGNALTKGIGKTESIKAGDTKPRAFLDPGSTHDNFACISRSFSPQLAPLGVNDSIGYVIPGRTASPCSAALDPSNVGQTIRQDLKYTGVIKASSESSSHEYPVEVLVPATCYEGEGDEGYEYDCSYYVTYYPIHRWYQGKTEPSSSISSSAEVLIPYNYELKPKVTPIQGPPGTTNVNFGGAKIDVTTTVNVATRKNADVSPKDPDYATITKPTQYRVHAFIVPSGTPKPNAHYDGDPFTGSAPNCTSSGIKHLYASSTNCALIQSDGDDGSKKIFNNDGHLKGTSDLIWNGKVTIPDAPIGTKFCIAVSVFPATSHGGETKNDGIAMKAESTGSEWSHSPAQCVTIAKKPTIQTWGAGIYTEGSIITSQSDKSPYASNDATQGNWVPRLTKESIRPDLSTHHYRTFGSWSEYQAIAVGRITGFASGAALGYNRGEGANIRDVNNTDYGNPLSSRLSTSNKNEGPGGYISTISETDCRISRLTISNTACGSILGDAENIDLDPSDIIAKLTDRYADFAEAEGTGTCLIFDFYDADPDPNREDLRPNAEDLRKCNPGDQHVRPAIRDDIWALGVGGNLTQVKYLRVDGDAYIPYGISMCTNRAENFSRVVIIDVKGKLTIKNDIGLGHPGASRIDCEPDTYSSISQIPQNIIFAGSIDITSDVKNIDAWVVVIGNKLGFNGSGNINTCAGHSIGTFTSEECANPLTFNGPVMANTITLNRTAGAGMGGDSVKPAETFNLRADAYLWAYAQSQRTTQATTNYTRELPPRF